MDAARNWGLDLRANYYGEVAGEGFTPGFKQTWDGATLFDAALGWNVSRQAGIQHRRQQHLRHLPGQMGCGQRGDVPAAGFVYGWETLPFGINGSYFYAR